MSIRQAFAFTYNDASGKSVTRSTMMDFNGDGFPDIFQKGIIQYTNSQGGYQWRKYSGIGTIGSENKSEGWALGSDPIISISSTTCSYCKRKGSFQQPRLQQQGKS